MRYISNTGVYGFSILTNRPESSTVQLNIKVNQTKGQSRIDNSDKLATLGTQDAGRRQKANEQKNKQKTIQTKNNRKTKNYQKKRRKKHHTTHINKED